MNKFIILLSGKQCLQKISPLFELSTVGGDIKGHVLVLIHPLETILDFIVSMTKMNNNTLTTKQHFKCNRPVICLVCMQVK